MKTIQDVKDIIQSYEELEEKVYQICGQIAHSGYIEQFDITDDAVRVTFDDGLDWETLEFSFAYLFQEPEEYVPDYQERKRKEKEEIERLAREAEERKEKEKEEREFQEFLRLKEKFEGR